MIDFLKGWVLNIITLVILIVLFEMLVPSGKIKKFVSLVSGFILIIAITSPIISFFSGELDLKEFQFSASNFMDKKEIELDSKVLKDTQMKQIAQNYKSKLMKQIEESTRSITEIDIVKADVVINEDYTSEDFGHIKSINLNLKMKDKKDELETVAKVEKVKIDLSEQKNEKNKNVNYQVSSEIRTQIESKITKILDVPKENIVISMQKN